MSQDKTTQEEIEKYIRRRHLDELAPDDLERAGQIAKLLYEHGYNNTIYTGISNEYMERGYLKALVDQNWIIIRLLSKLNEKGDGAENPYSVNYPSVVRGNPPEINDETVPESDDVFIQVSPALCPKCGAENPPGSFYCSKCKAVL